MTISKQIASRMTVWSTSIGKREMLWRRITIVAGELFALATVIMLFAQKRYEHIPLAFGTMAMVLIPEMLEWIFQCKIVTPVYFYSRFYTIGPILGEAYQLYHTLTWWDKLLHISGGVLFALFGFFLFEKLARGSKKIVIGGVVFALCFSMALALTWEFFEFGMDCVFHTDMQHDTVITEIHSYVLGDGVGVIGSVDEISEVTINGESVPIQGYLDIGLIDSMMDMLLESLGALITAVILLAGRGRHRAFIPLDDDAPVVAT